MSPDTKILLSYFILAGLVSPNVVKVINYTMEEVKRIRGERSFGKEGEKDKSDPEVDRTRRTRRRLPEISKH